MNRPALEAALATARATVATLELALAVADEPVDELLDLKKIKVEYSIGDEAVRNAISRGELAATRGPRQRIEVRRSELERWRGATPVHVRPRASRRGAEVIDLDAWEREADAQMARGAR